MTTSVRQTMNRVRILVLLIMLVLMASVVGDAEARWDEPGEPWIPRAAPRATRVVLLPPARRAYRVQRYSGSCVFAAFASVIGTSEQSLIDGYKASDIDPDGMPEYHGIDSSLLVKWLNTQGHHFENVLWFEHAIRSNPDWRSLAQETNLKGVIIARGHAWVLLGADENGLLVWDPLGQHIKLPYAGTTDLFLPIRGGFEDYDDQIEYHTAPSSKVVTSWGSQLRITE